MIAIKIASPILMAADPVNGIKLAPSYPSTSKCSIGESFSVKLNSRGYIMSVGYISFWFILLSWVLKVTIFPALVKEALNINMCIVIY